MVKSSRHYRGSMGVFHLGEGGLQREVALYYEKQIGLLIGTQKYPNLDTIVALARATGST